MSISCLNRTRVYSQGSMRTIASTNMKRRKFIIHEHSSEVTNAKNAIQNFER